MIISFLTQTVSDPEVPFPSNLGLPQGSRGTSQANDGIPQQPPGVWTHIQKRHNCFSSIHHVLILFGLGTSLIPPYHLTLSVPPSHSSFLWMSTNSSAEPGQAYSGLAHHFII